MAPQVPKDFRRVIIAAAVGNVIEWYDFYIFGSLAAVLSVKFFEKSHPVAALLSTIALFTAGFLIRPLGAFLFGWMGDRIGRKYTFLVTLSGMGGAGVGVGIIFGNYLAAALRNPSAAQGQFGNLIFGFAITEALGIFSLLIALLLLFAL